jgi:hypothetical protein
MKTVAVISRSLAVRACAWGLVLLVVGGAGGRPAQARPAIRNAFFQNYPSAIGTVLDTVPSQPNHCGVCHYKFTGGGTRNPYGEAVKNAGANSNAIWQIRFLDSDGDGFSNEEEITNTITYANTPTFPGLTVANTNLVSAVSLAEIAGHLTPVIGADTTPPFVQLLWPNGGQTLTANRVTNVTWSASDPSGIAAVHLFVSLDNGASYQPIARNLPNSGAFAWVPADRPTAQARLKVVATDTFGNTTNDVSDAVFAIVSPPFTNAHGVATTLRDFDMPGTQPFEHGPDLESSASCAACHGGYDAAVEPHVNWQGSMMAQASRDPLFLANLVIANQDAANSGDLCLRCHLPRGWLAGRSVPTDGSRMLPEDRDGVSCALCHRMVDPNYAPGLSPTNDLAILAALSFPGTNYGNGMYVVDSTGTRRGPYTNAVLGHASLGSPFHRSAAFCGTCHDVSNPAFTRDAEGAYVPNAPDAPAPAFSPHFIAPVERTYSEWLHSAYASSEGVYAPRFAGNRPDGRVSTCQHCHMRSIAGYACDTNTNPGVPLRADMGLHDMTGGSTWVPGLLTNLYPTEVSAAAIRAGIARAVQMLTNAATLAAFDAGDGRLKVVVTNECGHKLPTGYPEGRRVWLNVRFYDDAMNLLGESGAYDPATGELHRDAEAKIYEVHPAIDTNLATLLGLPPGASLHFVLNNSVYEDNRIPPRGFTNAAYAAFGGAPVGCTYADGQYWDETLYTRPPGTTRAVVRLYYQSTSREFIEFLRDENRTDSTGQALYELWSTNDKCPPTLMQEIVWTPIFEFTGAQVTPQGRMQIHFRSRPGVTYTIEYTDSLRGAPVWNEFVNNGSLVASGTASVFEDDFTPNTSGGPPATGMRFYRIRFNGTP